MLTELGPSVICEERDIYVTVKGGSFLIEKADWIRLNKYTWFVKISGTCRYVVRKVTSKNSVYFVRMHRQIMHTPADQVCHHMTGNSLDDRRRYLENTSAQVHCSYH